MHSKKILIVEDEKEAAELLAQFLRDEGFTKIEHAADGVQAVRKAGSFMPDLVLLDLKMPRADGITVLKKLKQTVSLAKVPIIVITGAGDDTIKKRLLSTGVCGYFQKPYKPDALLSGIKKALETANSDSVFGY